MLDHKEEEQKRHTNKILMNSEEEKKNLRLARLENKFSVLVDHLEKSASPSTLKQ
jgi:hypothetical protein